MTDLARRMAETATRASYGRLLSLLLARTRDIAAAEDALADAFTAALATWPARGIPARPEAWLLTAARNRLTNAARARASATAAEAEITRRIDELAEAQDAPDDRLRLLFLCAHPAMPEDARTPLMLQCVLGLDAARIARAFLVPPATMSQRLVRAKARIRDTGLRFDLTEADITPDRLAAVLDAVYAAFGTAWDSAETDLATEAIFLARLITAALPAEPEPKGLLALMLYTDARRPARRGPDGSFIPLDRQNPALWRRDMVIEAEALLTEAARAARFGRYQCEAAIQSVHTQAAVTGRLNRGALDALYSLLGQHAPSVGATVAHAAVTLTTGDPTRAQAILSTLPEGPTRDYQPYWVARARIAAALGQSDAQARARAIALTADPALRTHLEKTL